jgi:hypothetical protein
MTHGITKEVVRSTIDSLNDKAERLGWARRYEAQFGSNRNGVKHVLLTRTPERNHPVEQHPFATLSRFHNYLLAMGQAMNDAVLERARQRTEAMTRGIALDPGRTAGIAIFDPDARGLRPGE